MAIDFKELKREDCRTVARHLGLDPDKPPLAVVRDQEGRAAYACCGYQVGAADLLRRVLEQLV